jgi:hypothetical protein
MQYRQTRLPPTKPLEAQKAMLPKEKSSIHECPPVYFGDPINAI